MSGFHDIKSAEVVSISGFTDIVSSEFVLTNIVGCVLSGHSAGLWINIYNGKKRKRIIL